AASFGTAQLARSSGSIIPSGNDPGTLNLILVVHRYIIDILLIRSNSASCRRHLDYKLKANYPEKTESLFYCIAIILFCFAVEGDINIIYNRHGDGVHQPRPWCSVLAKWQPFFDCCSDMPRSKSIPPAQSMVRIQARHFKNCCEQLCLPLLGWRPGDHAQQAEKADNIRSVCPIGSFGLHRQRRDE